MKLRPHHVLDIIRNYGNGVEFKPHPYGHAVHIVAQKILSDVDQEVELIIGPDEICRPCRHLGQDGMCDDVLHQLDPPISKQIYNDELDSRLFPYLGIQPDTVMTIRTFLEIIDEKIPGIEKLCTHPGEDERQCLHGLRRGLLKLGLRQDKS
jgi:hypothetical protein